MKRVLAIDGGGIRGIIPAVVCRTIERWANQRIHTLFDLIAGSSTGGILAMGLAMPPNGKTAEELVEFYLQHGRSIFPIRADGHHSSAVPHTSPPDWRPSRRRSLVRSR